MMILLLGECSNQDKDKGEYELKTTFIFKSCPLDINVGGVFT